LRILDRASENAKLPQPDYAAFAESATLRIAAKLPAFAASLGIIRDAA
jgi:hypothetical protein